MKKLCIVCLLVLIFAGCSREKEFVAQTGLEGQTLPDFSLLMLDSTSYLHTADYRDGKPSILIYLSPTCPFCRMLTRRITTHIDKFKDVNILVFAYSDIKSVKAYADLYNLSTFPNIKVGIDTGGYFPRYFKTSLVPFTAIYSANKQLNKAFIGPVSVDTLLMTTKM
jgi:thiol-disulfide isomerase/thioredoxin